MSRHAAEHLLRLLLPAVARPVLLFLENPPPRAGAGLAQTDAFSKTGIEFQAKPVMSHPRSRPLAKASQVRVPNGAIPLVKITLEG